MNGRRCWSARPRSCGHRGLAQPGVGRRGGWEGYLLNLFCARRELGDGGGGGGHFLLSVTGKRGIMVRWEVGIEAMFRGFLRSPWWDHGVLNIALC